MEGDNKNWETNFSDSSAEYFPKSRYSLESILNEITDFKPRKIIEVALRTSICQVKVRWEIPSRLIMELTALPGELPLIPWTPIAAMAAINAIATRSIKFRKNN